MNDMLSQAQEFVQTSLDALLQEHNAEKFLSCLAAEFFLIGSNQKQTSYDRPTAAAILQRHIASCPERYRRFAKQGHAIAIPPDLCCVVINSTDEPDDTLNTISESWMIRRYPNHTIKIIHVHLPAVSSPDTPLRFTEEIMRFHDRIADGIAKVVYGTDRQVLYMSDRLIELFGYSREYIAKNNFRTVDYIVEEDLPALKAAVAQSLSTRKSYSARYRVRHKDGRIIWVKVNGLFMNELYLGSPIYYCIFTNITELMAANERLAMEKERYRIITELTEGITFEYDPHTDIFEFPNRYDQYFATPQTIAGFRHSDCLPNAPCGSFRQLIELFAKGIVDTHAELQLKTRSGDLEWFAITLCTLHDEQGRTAKIIGKMANIHQKKMAQLDLEDKSKHDLMTNLFNKITAEHQTQDYLSRMMPDSLAAFLMIDIDNFKEINDTMGHFVGDHVICSIADHMRHIFRNTDILGRFGGDEFLVLMKEVKDEFLVREKACKLSQCVLDTYRTDRDGYQVSLSIGIAIIPGHTQHSYHRIFQMADKALYAAKNSGKNQFCVYNEWMERTKISIHSLTPNHTVAESKDQQHSYLGVVNTALDLLLQAKDPQAAIANVFQCLGSTLNLRKAYAGVFIGDQLTIPVQWIQFGLTSLPQSLAIAKEDLLRNFNRSGMLLCSDIATLTPPLRAICEECNATGLLQCLIYQNDQPVGLVGLGCCGSQRIWTQNEIDILQTITKVLTKPILTLVNTPSIPLDLK